MPGARYRNVRFTAAEMASDVPKELDFSKVKYVGRGPAALAKAARRTLVPLDADVAKVFIDAREVNDALRGLIQLSKRTTRSRRMAMPR
jgi:hypothetical protein